MIQAPSFTIGLEEEYLLVDLESRDLAADPPAEFMAACQNKLKNHVHPEFLRCQIEITTPICKTIHDMRHVLGDMRSFIAQEATRYGLAPMAASTHPFADWNRLLHTDEQRYNELADDLKMVVRRLMISGMHVHVAIEDEALRMDIFNQLVYFLPHLLALSASSPFWRGQKTGLKSYRLSVFNEMPRTGLPEFFTSHDEFQRTIDMLSHVGALEDASKIWWDLRPSTRFPTIELRICDVCTEIEDALAIAALFQCICRMLYRLRQSNQRWRQYSRFLIEENRWLAQRHGVSGKLIDFGLAKRVPFHELIAELVELVREDAIALNALDAVEHAKTIATRGTSADRQLELYDKIFAETGSETKAIHHVADYLINHI